MSKMKKAKRKSASPRSPNAIDEFIGDRMRVRRQALGISQADLGKTFGRLVPANSEIRKREDPRQRGAPFRYLQGLERLAVVDV